MKPNYLTYVTGGLIVLQIILIVSGGNVLAYEYAHTSLAPKVIGWACMAFSLIWTMIGENIDVSKTNWINTVLKNAIWGIPIIIAMLLFGYFSVEFNNPYL